MSIGQRLSSIVDRAKPYIAPVLTLALVIAVLDKMSGIDNGTILIFVIVGWYVILKRIDELSDEIDDGRKKNHENEPFQYINHKGNDDSF